MANFFKQNWGNLASVVGLVVSLGVLWVAQKAQAVGCLQRVSVDF